MKERIYRMIDCVLCMYWFAIDRNGLTFFLIELMNFEKSRKYHII